MTHSFGKTYSAYWPLFDWSCRKNGFISFLSPLFQQLSATHLKIFYLSCDVFISHGIVSYFVAAGLFFAVLLLAWHGIDSFIANVWFYCIGLDGR